MLFSTVLSWLLVAVGFVVALPALWLLARGLWPETAMRYRDAANRGLFKCFLLGLVPLISSVLLIVLLSKTPKMGAFSILIGGVMIAWGFVGAGGIATLIGERLWPNEEPWRQTKQGGLALVLCALLPVVGWVVLLPMIAILGWGIGLRAWFLKTPQPTPVIAPPISSEAPTA